MHLLGLLAVPDQSVDVVPRTHQGIQHRSADVARTAGKEDSHR
jgi:hypothetical protein